MPSLRSVVAFAVALAVLSSGFRSATRAGETAPAPAASPSGDRPEGTDGPGGPLRGKPGDDANAVLVELEPRRRAVLSAEVSAVVLRLHREMGQTFSEGDPLVELDDRLYRGDLRKAEARRDAARARLATVERLHADNSASNIDLAEARAAARVADEERDQARERVRQCAIAAPYAGRVVENAVETHELVRRGDALVEIVDDRTLRARFLLPARLFGRIGLGDAVPVRIEAGAAVRTVRARVSHLGAELDPAAAAFLVFASVPNEDGTLRSGMTGRLDPDAFVPAPASDNAAAPPEEDAAPRGESASPPPQTPRPPPSDPGASPDIAPDRQAGETAAPDDAGPDLEGASP